MFLSKPMLGTHLDHSDSLNNPVLDLLFNEGHGNIVNDLSGYGNHGTLHGFDFPPTQNSGWNPGVDGVALVFDGVDDYISVPDSPSLRITKAITVGALIKTKSATACSIIVNKPESYQLAVLDGMFQYALKITDPGWAWINTEVLVSLNEWQDVSLVYDSRIAGGVENLKFYLNGVERYSYAGSGTIATNEWDVGIGAKPSPDYFFNGAIARARILPRAMSAFEVMQRQINPYAGYLQ